MSRTSALQVRSLFAAALLSLVVCPASRPQQSAAPPASEDAAKKEKSPELPAQIELLETHVRFEANGDSRKEVHTLVRINNQLGARQFARLNFDYNRAFEQVDLPLVRVTHASGGTADILPSAIADNPNPAVVNAPAYQDVRVKSVRILGLAEGDHLEYRVITTTTHHPLAPDFWLDHAFDHTGVVSREIFELDLPASRLKDSSTLRRVELRFNAALAPAETRNENAADGSARSIYRWQISLPASTKKKEPDTAGETYEKPDITLSSFIVWGVFSQRFAGLFHDATQTPPSVLTDKAAALTKGLSSPQEKLEALYNFVSQKVATVDLPLGATGFRTSLPAEILSRGYATPEDKFVLLAALAVSLNISLEAGLTGPAPDLSSQLPEPSLFTHVLTLWGTHVWCDPSLEVAPFELLAPELRGKQALWLRRPPDCGPLADCAYNFWAIIPVELPFAAFQKVRVDATLASDGALSAKVKYTIRGNNELLLRVAFHQTAREKWNEVAQLLSLSDGFRGKITKVSASDPRATKDPFTLEYEITQAKFVDWSKSPVHIPAILPLVGLPDPPAKPAAGAASAAIDLGTPLDVQATVTLLLPPGTVAHPPIGTSVSRDYATFSSQYATRANTVTASRHINFLLREVPAARAIDYNAFLRAVQNDEAQSFTLDPPTGTQPRHPTSAEATSSAPSRPKPQ